MDSSAAASHDNKQPNDTSSHLSSSSSGGGGSSSGGSLVSQHEASVVYVRVSITDHSVQKVLKLRADELVWAGKQRVLATLAKEVKDGLNYGFYLPPCQGRAGKFLDDSRQLKEYSLANQQPPAASSAPIAHLEFKYKKRVYKFAKINQKELRALNVKANYKRFLELVRTNQVAKVARLLDKGLDPNFHSDLGGTSSLFCYERSKFVSFFPHHYFSTI